MHRLSGRRALRPGFGIRGCWLWRISWEVLPLLLPPGRVSVGWWPFSLRSSIDISSEAVGRLLTSESHPSVLWVASIRRAGALV